MLQQGDSLNRGAGVWHARRANFVALAVLTLVLIAILATPLAHAGSATTRLIYNPGKIVPIPASIPHEEGDMVDRRIVGDLLWISKRFPIYVTDGYSGPLPNGKHVGCNRCHTRHSDHYNGLAVDLVPLGGGMKCDRSWLPITRLALWAEPTQNHPAPPFRWVGYDGDGGHGCGHHLHLSWNHSPTAEYQLAEWVEVLPKGPSLALPLAPKAPPAKNPPPKPAPGPSGGISQFQSGGVAPRD